MGILGIRNRTENWKTAHSFAPFFECDSARTSLAKRLLDPLGKAHEVQSGTVKIELFWKGVRDYLQMKERSVGELFDLVADIYLANSEFRNLREEIIEFSGLSAVNDCNYDACNKYRTRLSGQVSDKLSNNLFNTEIDIVLQTPKHLFIGEAKYEEDSFETKGEHVLVHQLIREYVVATILVDLIGCDKQIVPFVVGASGNLEKMKKRRQVKFMECKGWLNEKNILSWDCIEKLASSGANNS